MRSRVCDCIYSGSVQTSNQVDIRESNVEQMPRNPVCNMNICVLWLGKQLAQKKKLLMLLSD